MRGAALALALALLTAGAQAQPLACPLSEGARAALRADFAVAFEAFRAEHDLPPAPRDARIEAAARDWAARLAVDGRLAHEDAAGRGVGDRLSAAGLDWGYAAENLAAGDIPDARALLSLWAESPGHRRNLLAERAARHGLGAACGADGAPVFALALAD